MFRGIRRSGQALSKQECIEILIREPRGVLAVKGEDGYPYALPMNFVYSDGKIYFHSATDGHKLDALKADNRVSFCVMDKGVRKEDEWALKIKSVIIFGKITKIDDFDETLRIMRQFGLKYYPTLISVEQEIRKSYPNVRILELAFDHMTGKVVKES